MTINGINEANTQMGQMGMNQATDSYSRNIQNQIANAQKQLQELSSNENMTLEEKMKKRQEIQQQISDLNMQLRQHKMERRKEKQQTKGSSMEDLLGGTGNAGSVKEGSKSTGLSQASMTAIISGGTAIKQAKVQGSVAANMEGSARVLESEIKLDQARGGDTQKKGEELADIEQKAQAAASAQISTLADAGKTMEKAAKEDATAEKTNSEDKRGKKPEEKVSGTDMPEAIVNTQSEVSGLKSAAVSETAVQTTAYTPVDVRL